MEVKDEVVKTEVGIIPKDWDVKKLGDCLVKNPDYGLNAAAVKYDDSLPTYLRITDISEDGRYLSSKKVSVNSSLANSYYLEEGDTVFARTGASVGKTYLYNKNDGKLVFAGFLIRVKPNPKMLDSRYLIYLTQTSSYWAWVAANSMRSGQPGLNSNEYKLYLIPLPPLPEQQAIAEVLTDTDSLILALENQIAKKRRIKQGVMQELLTLKEGWEVKRFENIFEVYGGYSATREQLSDNGYCYLHYGDIHGSTKTNIDCSLDFFKIPKLKVELRKISKTSLLRDGDIVFVDASEDEEGTSRHLVIKNERNVPFISGLHTIIARSKDDSLDLSYKNYCFQTKSIKDQFRFYAVGTKVSGVSKTSIKNILILVPPLDEQKRITSVLESMDIEIEALGEILVKYKSIKQGLMQNLLTGKIRLI